MLVAKRALPVAAAEKARGVLLIPYNRINSFISRDLRDQGSIDADNGSIASFPVPSFDSVSVCRVAEAPCVSRFT